MSATPFAIAHYFIVIRELWLKLLGSHDPVRIKNVFRAYGVYPFNPAALDTTKLRQHAAIQEAEYYKQCCRRGMSHDEATQEARRKMTEPPFQYEEQWKRDYVDLFVRQVQVPAANRDDQVAQLVNRSIVEVQQKAFIAAQSLCTPQVAIQQKRRNKAVNHDAVILTTTERLEQLQEREQALKIKEDRDAKRKAYNARRALQMEELKAEKERNAIPLKNAKSRLTVLNRELKKLVTAHNRANPNEVTRCVGFAAC